MKNFKKTIAPLLTAAVLLIAVFTAGCARQAEASNKDAVLSANFSDAEFAKLSALQFDGYEEMTVSEFQNRVWELTDTNEYRSLLERFFRDAALYEQKDSNALVSFLFYTLEPLTAEKWRTRDFGGSIPTDYPGAVDNASLEFVYSLTVQNADTLTVGAYNAACLGVTNGLQSILQDKTKEQLKNDSAMQEAIDAAIENLKDEHAAGGTPTAVRIPQPDGVNKPVEFSFFIPQQYGSAAILTQYPTYSELLEDYYATKDRAERLKQKSRELYKAVHNLYERAVRKQSARREELAQSEKADILRLYGELLQANQWAIQKGDRQATVQNYYTGENVTIRLDPRLGPNENAQKYFRDYKKKQTAGQMLKKLLLEGEDEIEYLANVLYEVETAPGEQALNEVRAELKSQGYLKYYKQRERKQKPADFLRYRSSDGFEILIGRNNLQNDKLTLHTARGKDVWFHVQKAPGSHTVVMSRGEDVPDTTKQEAAELAVLHSSQNGGAKVPVDTTEVRNIWKANGARPGMVLYNDYTTVYITPRAGLEEQLREK